MTDGDSRGRGRLSTIDRLPPEAQPHLDWALAALRARQLTQVEILAEFNRRLVAEGFEPVSNSAFNRYSLRVATALRRLQGVAEIARSLNERLSPGTTDDVTVVAAEAIKTLVWELLEGEGLGPTEASRLATALRQATEAQAISAQRRAKLEAAFQAQAASALSAVAAKRGLDALTVAAIKREVLGVADDAA